jgi:hypothetical protein
MRALHFIHRRTYSVLSIARRHPLLFSRLTTPRALALAHVVTHSYSR